MDPRLFLISLLLITISVRVSTHKECTRARDRGAEEDDTEPDSDVDEDNSAQNDTVQNKGLKCGQVDIDDRISKKSIRERIFNGVDVLPGRAPYQVTLSKEKDGKRHVCSGVVVDTNLILTAASCLKEKYGRFERLYAIMGNTQREGLDGARVWAIKEYIRHPKYKKVDGFPINDIAALITRNEIDYQLTGSGVRSINKVCLPDYSAVYHEKEQMKITGWGHTSVSLRPSILQSTEVFYMNSDMCMRTYNIPADKEKTIVCTRGIMRGPCFGDQGSPLVRWVKEKEGYELVGIFSYNKYTDDEAPNCGDAPAVYTKVANYIRWIREL